MSCKVNLEMLDQTMPMVFTPDTECLVEGISIPDSVAVVKSGAGNNVNETSYKSS